MRCENRSSSLSPCTNWRKADAEKIELLARAEAEKISLTGNAEAEKILAIGKSSAESYKLAVAGMGGDNFTQLKIMESIGAQQVRIMPEVLIHGGGDGNGSINGLLGLQLLEQLRRKAGDKPNNDTDNSAHH